MDCPVIRGFQGAVRRAPDVSIWVDKAMLLFASQHPIDPSPAASVMRAIYCVELCKVLFYSQHQVYAKRRWVPVVKYTAEGLQTFLGDVRDTGDQVLAETTISTLLGAATVGPTDRWQGLQEELQAAAEALLTVYEGKSDAREQLGRCGAAGARALLEMPWSSDLSALGATVDDLYATDGEYRRPVRLRMAAATGEWA